MLELLAKLFRQVRTYMLSERFKRNQVYGQFAGHTTMVFDREAEDIIIKGLTESGLGFEVISEERPAFSTRPSPPYRIVIDPVDGSTNIMRGVTTAAGSLAGMAHYLAISAEQGRWGVGGETLIARFYSAPGVGGVFLNWGGAPGHAAAA